jgi:hypothetical protein
MAFELVQILYWLALATWFGGALFVAVASRVIFKTVQEANPILPHVLSVNLEGQHGTLLAGTIVGNILTVFTRIELACCGALFLTIVAQTFFVDLHDPAVFAPLALRGCFLLAAAALVVYDWQYVWPRLWKYRQEFLDHADEPDVANPAKDQFDRYQRESAKLLEAVLFLLLGMVLFSGASTLSAVHYSRPEQLPEKAALLENQKGILATDGTFGASRLRRSASTKTIRRRDSLDDNPF